MGTPKATPPNNILSQELLVNSYEARLLYSGYSLFDINDEKFKIDIAIEQDLYYLYTIFKDLKLGCKKINNAILFFYRWAHKVTTLQKELLNYKNKHEILIAFLILYHDLAVCLYLIEDYSNSGELDLLDKDEKVEVREHLKVFQDKYIQLYYIFKIYQRVVENIKAFLLAKKDDTLDTLVKSNLTDKYFILMNSIDNETFSNCLELTQEVLYDDTPNRYEVLRDDILKHITKLGGSNKNCIVRDTVIKTKEGTKVYKAILAKFNICEQIFIYSNTNLINAYEINQLNTLMDNMLLPIDKFMLWYHFSTSSIDNYLFHIARCENRYGTMYDKFIQEHYHKTFANLQTVINAQIDELIKKMPQTELFSFFEVLQNKISYNVKGMFYDPNKQLLKTLSTGNKVELQDFSFTDCKMLFDSISKYVNHIFESRSENAQAQSQNSTK